ncbi:MAG TPA: metallophosphoesterase family protein [Atribacteraceae bacterium]|nr:metallophosphoesterase family protein [Atribacteraceae bacterium]
MNRRFPPPPMTIAVFSDIHGNAPAREAVLSDIASCGVEHLVCLGDLVGYAPFPNNGGS